MLRDIRNWLVTHPIETVVGSAALGVALFLVIGLGVWASSRPPGPRVYEGTVSERIFRPAHDETYLVQTWIGETCHTSYVNSTPSRSCTPNYIWVPHTRRIPDAWSLKVKGCKRRAKDNPIDYCEKQGTRRVAVGEATYMATKVGDRWHDPSLDRLPE